MRAARAFSLVTVALVSACSILPVLPSASNPFPVDVAVVIPPAQMSVGIGNETSIAVRLTVNGTVVRIVEPGDRADVPASGLPSLPWLVQLRTSSGRVLLEMTAREGDEWQRRNADGSFEQHGDTERVRLSCGWLELYAVSAIEGPPAGSPVPGDCDP